MKSDAELLREYVERRSEPAFTELVQRYVDFVYSSTIRQVGGDAHLAKDAAQSVFSDLARKAPSLLDRAVLGGWLYKSAHFAAAKVVRAERRRRELEHETHTMQQLTSADAQPDWNRLCNVLDSAMLDLNEVDREAVLLRYFTGQSFADIGMALKMNEDTARKRVDRALDKLHGLLGKRGISSTAAGLGLALSQHSVSGAPAGIAASFASSAMSGVTVVGSGAGAALTALTFMSTSKIAMVAGVAVVLALGSAFYYAEITRPRSPQPTWSEGMVPAGAVHPVSKSDDVGESTGVAAALKAGIEGDRVDRYRRLVKQLRQAGFGDDMVRLFVRASLDQDLAKKKALLMSALPFWRETLTPEMVEAMRHLQRENRNLLGAFFGATAALESQDPPLLKRQYGNLPLDRAAKIEQIKDDYLDMQNAVLQAAGSSPTDRRQQLALLKEQEKADIAKALTAEELEQYEMRNSSTASEVSKYVASIDLTDAQFTALFELHEAFNQKAKSLSQTEFALAQAKLFDAAAAILSSMQYYSYLANADGNFASIKNVTDTFSIDPSVALQAAHVLRQMVAGSISQAEGAPQIIQLLGPSAARAYQGTPPGKWLAKYTGNK
jgi:RNA polymerase sigma factor (sigma-70 family)